MHTTDNVLELLNVSPTTLDHLVKSGIVLRVIEDNSSMYPKRQFSNHGLDANFASIVSCFKKTKLTGNTIWEWLNSSSEDFDGESPLDYLERTNDVDRIRFVASVNCDFTATLDPSQSRTDWLKTSDDSSEDGIGDYTPKRRGGQNA